MEKSSHTPGPWEIKEGDTLIIANVIDTQDDYDYLMVAGAVGLPDDPVTLANLSLIAAAPELLEALRLAKRHIAHMARWIEGRSSGYSFEALGEDMPSIDAAIAKAMGE